MDISYKIWIYWLFCLFAMALIAFSRKAIPQLLSPRSKPPFPGSGYRLLLGAGWASTLLTEAAYILTTHKLETGAYTVPDLLIYSILNGVLEQFMFVVWFLAGCWIARRVTRKPVWIFAGGFLGFALFSGAIHAFFWVRVLPPHIPMALVMPAVLVTMSFLWMWLFWRYRALAAIVMMHVVVDFLMIGHLNSHWFDSLALR